MLYPSKPKRGQTYHSTNKIILSLIQHWCIEMAHCKDSLFIFWFSPASNNNYRIEPALIVGIDKVLVKKKKKKFYDEVLSFEIDELTASDKII